MSILFEGTAFSNIPCEREKFKSGAKEITYGSLRLGVTRCKINNSTPTWFIPKTTLVLEVSYRINHYAADSYKFIKEVSTPSLWRFEVNRVFTSRKLTPSYKKGRSTHYVKTWGNNSAFTNSLGDLVETSLISYESLSELNKQGEGVPVERLIEMLVTHSNEDLVRTIKSISELQII